jgi:glycosyltransferase involved in cell wall biosynthesis
MHSIMGAIILITPGFPENEKDTACLPSIQQFALAIRSNFPSLELIIVSMHYPFEQREYLWNGIRVIAIGGKNKRFFWNLLTRRKTLNALKKIKSEQTIKGLISLWCTDAALMGNQFSLKYGYPHYIWIIGQDAKKDNTLVSKIKPQPEQLIAMSYFLKTEFYKNHGIIPKYTIENGINEAVFPAFNAEERSIHVLGAGSLIPLKNYSLFVELIFELKKTFPLIKSMLIGGGEQFEVLRLKIEELELQNNIQLKGAVSHFETLQFMSQSKIFLHTSTYEGNSTVLMEALYSGCSVVSTCALSERAVPHLYIRSAKKDLTSKLKELLSIENQLPPSAIIFNTMNDSAKKIIQLFD